MWAALVGEQMHCLKERDFGSSLLPPPEASASVGPPVRPATGVELSLRLRQVDVPWGGGLGQAVQPFPRQERYARSLPEVPQ